MSDLSQIKAGDTVILRTSIGKGGPRRVLAAGRVWIQIDGTRTKFCVTDGRSESGSWSIETVESADARKAMNVLEQELRDFGVELKSGTASEKLRAIHAALLPLMPEKRDPA